MELGSETDYSSQRIDARMCSDHEVEEKRKQLHRDRVKKHYYKKKYESERLANLLQNTTDELAFERRRHGDLSAANSMLSGMDSVSIRMANVLLSNKGGNDTSSTATRRNIESHRLVPLGSGGGQKEILQAQDDTLTFESLLDLSQHSLDVETFHAATKGPPEALFHMWQKFIPSLATRLETIQSSHKTIDIPSQREEYCNNHTDADENIKALDDDMNTMGLAMTLAMTCNPNAMFHLWSNGTPPPPPQVATRQELRDWEVACDRMYSRVVDAMQILPWQKELAMVAWGEYEATCDQSTAQRASHILRLYQEFLGVDLNRKSMRHSTENQANSFQHLKGISQTTESKHAALLRLMEVSGSIFSTVQKARAAVSASPYFPDILHVMRVLAAAC